MQNFSEFRENFSNGWSDSWAKHKLRDLPSPRHRIIHVDANHKLIGLTTHMTGSNKNDTHESFIDKPRNEIEDKLKQLYVQYNDGYGKNHVLMSIKHNDESPEIIHNSIQFNKIRDKISQAHANTDQSEPNKMFHVVSFADKDKAKSEGMKWDAIAKKWYHTDTEKSNKSGFKRV